MKLEGADVMHNIVSTIITPLEKFTNKSTSEIGHMIELNANLISKKTSISTLANSMFSYANINLTTLKSDYNLTLKTVRLKENGVPKEAMSFEQVQFHQVINEKWETSFLKKKFTHTTFLFAVFQYVGDELYFKGIKLWKMPEEIINHDLKDFWLLLKKRLENGIVLNKVSKGNKTITENNLPSSNESKIMHIRPKAKNAMDIVELPDGQFISKQAYWFNTSYVSSILSDMPKLKIKSKQVNQQTLKYNYQQIKPLLSEDIYTIDQFIKIAQNIFSSFNTFDVIESELGYIGYKLFPPFILHHNFDSLDTYFNNQILQNRYFELPDDDVWQNSFIQRRLENMENSYLLFKINDSTYLTETALKAAGIEKATLISYRESVEAFVKKGQFFTLPSLKKDGFNHPIEDFGFEPLFYESLLKRPGRLKSLKLCGHLFFVKSPLKVNLTHFLDTFFTDANLTALSIDDLIEQVYNTYCVKLNFDDINNLLKSSFIDQYYSEQLYKIFRNKKAYLDYIY